jgi:hypothetical protein
MWPPGIVSLMLRGLRLPRVDPERATCRLIGQIRRLVLALSVPVLLENMPALPFPGFAFEAEPGRIRRVLGATGCDLLLDIGHVRIAAQALGVEVTEYLEQLPLERVRQIHASGARQREGTWFDAHEPLAEADYGLLAHLIERTQPAVLTLEYIREPEALRQQLTRLRAML